MPHATRPAYDDVRRHILDVGQDMLARKGFAGVGLNELLAAADVPKGSFYHYFGSKEQYGCALIEQYVDDYLAAAEALFADTRLPAYERLMRYWNQWRDGQCAGDATGRCLVVKLSAEVSDLSDAMRERLRDGTTRMQAQLAGCIAQGQAEGAIAPGLDPAQTATVLYQMWLGASLLTKLRRDHDAFDEAMAATRRMLAPAPA